MKLSFAPSAWARCCSPCARCSAGVRLPGPQSLLGRRREPACRRGRAAPRPRRSRARRIDPAGHAHHRGRRRPRHAAAIRRRPRRPPRASPPSPTAAPPPTRRAPIPRRPPRRRGGPDAEAAQLRRGRGRHLARRGRRRLLHHPRQRLRHQRAGRLRPRRSGADQARPARRLQRDRQLLRPGPRRPVAQGEGRSPTTATRSINHSLSFACLAGRPCGGAPQQPWTSPSEIDQATELLQKNAGAPVRYFAFPFDACGPEAMAHLRQRGYLGARCGGRGVSEPGFPDGFASQYDVWGPAFSIYGTSGPCMGLVLPNANTRPSACRSPAAATCSTSTSTTPSPSKGWAIRTLAGFVDDPGAFQPIDVADYIAHLDYIKARRRRWASSGSRAPPASSNTAGPARSAPCPTVEGNTLRFPEPAPECQLVRHHPQLRRHLPGRRAHPQPEGHPAGTPSGPSRPWAAAGTWSTPTPPRATPG